MESFAKVLHGWLEYLLSMITGSLPSSNEDFVAY
jgi:hypothetical protein